MPEPTKKVPLFFRLPSHLDFQVRKLAKIENRPIGNMYTRLVEKGLEAFHAVRHDLQG